MVARTRLTVTLYVRNCLSCLALSLFSSHFVSSHFLIYIYFLSFVSLCSLIHVFYFLTLHESGISLSWLVYGLYNQAVGGSIPSKDRLFSKATSLASGPIQILRNMRWPSNTVASQPLSLGFHF